MAARAGMADLITKLRALTSSGSADYSVNSVTYWTDDQLQSTLDQHRTDFRNLLLTADPTLFNSVDYYYDYYVPDHDWLEGTASGTAAWMLTNGTGGTVAFSDYTLNIDAKHLKFSANQEGTAYYLAGRAFDLYSAASDVWESIASSVWDRFDLRTDNHDMSRSQLYDHATKQAARMRAKGGITSSIMTRPDVWVYGD
jgi:hypothetical protein